MPGAAQGRALYDFDPQAAGEISIWANEIVTITNQNVGEGWCEGINSRGECGLFPANYVEKFESSPPPPAITPPPLPPQSGSSEAGDDPWDDDWDRDDDDVTSNTGGHFDSPLTGPGVFGLSVPQQNNMSGSKGDLSHNKQATVRKFNRFSNFVKSGGESFLLGTTKIASTALEHIYVLEDGQEIYWQPNDQPYTCQVSSPKKESKLKGLKTFIAYTILPSFTGIPVSRRYKHFDWLHERLQEKYSLIPIPPLPEKQISGRYENEFIDHRMTQLQLWVNRITRHPVLSQSAVWIHFLTCPPDERQWKNGKRKAEQDELVGAKLFVAIETPEASLDTRRVDGDIESFSRFVTKMDESVTCLLKTANGQAKKCNGPYKQQFVNVATSLRDLAQAFDSDFAKYSQNLNNALSYTGDTFDCIGKLYDENARKDWESLSNTLYEYKGILTSWPEIINIHKTFMGKRREYGKMCEEGRMTREEFTQIEARTDKVSYAVEAEMAHFHRERVHDFSNMMYDFLGGQITFYQKIVEKLQEAQQHYQSS